jgi:RNA polymerase sigma-70 factor (ECF subfamily)
MPSAPEAVEFENFDDLLTAARAGDSIAQGSLLEVGCRLLSRLPPKQMAKAGRWHRESDVWQEGCLSALEQFHLFQGRTQEEFLAWLRMIVQHAGAGLTRRSLAEKRGAIREVSADAPGFHESPHNALPAADEVLARREQDRLTWAAIDRLPEDHKQVMYLRIDRAPWEEIGQIMGRTSAAVRQLHMRAMQKMVRELTDK